MDLDELRVFVAIVDRGSFAAAAKALRFPFATLRRRFDELEASVNAPHADAVRFAGAVFASERLMDLTRILSNVREKVSAAASVTSPCGSSSAKEHSAEGVTIGTGNN